MAYFIPNEIKKIIPHDRPWITKPMLDRKNRLGSKDMGINQRTRLGLAMFVKIVKKQLKLPN